MTPSIRELYPDRSDELDAIAAIWFDGNVETHRFVDSSKWDTLRGDFLEIAVSVGSTVLVAEDGGRICGFCCIHDGEMTAMFVEASARNRGIGTSLTAEAKRRCTGSLTVGVFVQNIRAKSFFERNGFKVLSGRADPATGKFQTVLSWSAPVAASARVPEDIEKQLAHIKDEVGPAMFELILDDIRGFQASSDGGGDVEGSSYGDGDGENAVGSSYDGGESPESL